MSSGRSSRRPAHLRLRDALALRIAAGEWRAGKPLPSESALAREFSVSCRTVRAALDILKCEGVVRCKRGGTFVASDDHGRYSGRSRRELERARRPSRIIPARLTEGLADRAERARLQLRGKDRVYRIHCTRASKGRALVAETVVLPAALFPGLAERAEVAYRIVDLAEAYDVQLGRALERISIGVASPATATGVDEGTPVLVLDRVILTEDGRPAEWRMAECVLTPENGLTIIARADEHGC
jgi:GntR family transcriptional regulator